MRLQPRLKKASLRTTASALPTAAGSNPADIGDADLVAWMKRGETAALDAVLRRYWSQLVVYLIRLTGSREAAEDIAQRTFFQLWERRTQWQPDGSLRGLIFRIARNFAISERRRFLAEARSVAALSDIGARSSTTPLELLEDQQLRLELGRAIQALPERRRETFILRCLHDLSYKEIAQVMDTSPQTVANQLSAALATLRRALGHLLDE
jgi:RNA polymerase sigma-70 factor (ECF subfamily)